MKIFGPSKERIVVNNLYKISKLLDKPIIVKYARTIQYTYEYCCDGWVLQFEAKQEAYYY